MKGFSKFVVCAMKNKAVNTKDLAQKTNISLAYLYDLLKGKKRWNSSTIDNVCEGLGIEIEFKIAN